MTRALPIGTLTFMFTDIEGSTEVAQRLGAGYPDLVAGHFSIIRDHLKLEEGVEVKTMGDGVFAVFTRVQGAMRAAGEIQEAVSRHSWPEGGDIRLRIGLHTGEATMADGDYVGIEVIRAARIMAAGHGGQVLISEATRLLGGAGFEYLALGRHTLRGLEHAETVFQLLVEGLPSDFPPIRTASAIPNNLPVRDSTILGRDDDIEAVIGLLDENRLVTVLGPGGIGKTSLAVTVGGRVLDRFGGGVRFVELAAITDQEFVVSEIADQLAAEPKTIHGIAARIGDSSVLLILDNFEQVLQAAEAIGQLLESCDQLRLLVTSQAPLRLNSEQRYVLRTLGMEPTADSPGVQLFNQRARAVDPSFSSDPEEVAVLVQMLDGLPLAIELTAAMANLLTPSEMIKRLDAGKLASRSPTGAPERHRSLDDAVGWSYGLLDPGAQVVFRRLSVFAGGMTLNAAEEIAGDDSIDPLPSIAELVDRSLLVRRSNSTSGFRMLDGIRHFASRRLAESDEHDVISARYVDYFLQMASDAHVGLQSDRGEWWRSRIDEELGNFREVLSILHRSPDAARGLDILGSIWRFYQSSGKFFELGIWLDRFFALPGADAETVGRVKGLMARAAATYWLGEPASAIADYEEALAIARALGGVSLTADAMFGLGTSLIVAEQTSDALDLLEEAGEMYRELGDVGGMADIVAGKAFSVIRQHGLIGLGPTFVQAFDLYAEAGRQIQASQSILAQSAVAIAEERFDDARGLARTAIERGVELNDVFLQTWGLEYMARIELEFDHPELGALYAGAARSAREQMGGGWGPGSVGLATAEELLAERFGDDEATAMMRPGEAIELADAVGMILGADRSDLEDEAGLSSASKVP